MTPKPQRGTGVCDKGNSKKSCSYGAKESGDTTNPLVLNTLVLSSIRLDRAAA